MKAILAVAAAAALSGCAYYDPYVNTPYYGTAPGYYGGAPQPYYYGGTVVPYGYGAYGYYDYPNVYPGYPAYPWIAPAPRLHPRRGGPRPEAHAPPSDGGGSGYRPPQPRSRGSVGGGGSGWEPGGAGISGPTGGGGSGYVPNQPPDK